MIALWDRMVAYWFGFAGRGGKAVSPSIRSVRSRSAGPS